MAFTDLVPWGRNRNVPSTRLPETGDAFTTLHREMNRMFDDFAQNRFAEGPFEMRHRHFAGAEALELHLALQFIQLGIDAMLNIARAEYDFERP